MIYFTSDTHFNQERTLQLSRRPFKDVNEMNNVLIDNWNKTVSKTDEVIHLGDFGDLEFVNKLNGKIFLLFGNYERDDKEFNDKIKKYPNIQIITPPNDKILRIKTVDSQIKFRIMHQPIFDMKQAEQFCLFGHIHNAQMIRRNGLNVGIDCHHYYPISIDTVFFYKNAIYNHYDNYVFGDKE